MAELQKMIQNSNGSFQSDLMKKFVAQHKTASGEFSKPSPPAQILGGASRFTSTSTTTTGADTTDNANILRQDVNDNQQAPATTTTTGGNDTTTNANTNPPNRNLNRNLNNANRNNCNAKKTTTTTSQGASPDCLDPNANHSEVNAVLEEVRGTNVTEARQALLQLVTDATVDAHLATCSNTHKAVEQATARFMAMKESGQLPDMSKLSLNAGSMWEKMMDQMMPEICKTMKFFKMLPGFSELRPEDQMLLIKQGSFEVMMTRFSMLINHEKETMLDPSHKMVCPRQVIREMPMGQFLDGFFHVGAQFNPIGLSDGEIALFTAVLAFSPCRPGLGDIKLIATLQTLYQQAFFHLLKKNNSDPEDKFKKTLSLVPMFRRINEEHSKALGSMKMQSPDAFDKQFPPVHKEMYSPESQ